MNAADFIVKYLEEMGVKYIFGVPGVKINPLYTAINQSKKIEAVITSHEEGAAYMADGYARYSNMMGVCFANSGTSLINSIASSYADSVPVFVITGQVPIEHFGNGALQDTTFNDIGIDRMFTPVTKYSAMVINHRRLGHMFKQAMRMALTGRRRPVHLNIPINVLLKEIEEDITPRNKFLPKMEKCFPREKLKKAASLLLEAERPAILMGNGALISGATNEIIKIADNFSIPVLTTPKAKGGFPEDHNLSLGVFGFGGTPQADKHLIQLKKVDVLLTAGTSFNESVIHAWDKRLIPEKGIIQIDIDSLEFGKNYPFEIDLMGDAKTILHELLYELNRQINGLQENKRNEIKKKCKLRITEIKNFKKKYGRYTKTNKISSGNNSLNAQRLIQDIQDSFPKKTIFFVNMSNSMSIYWAIHYLNINKPYTFFAGLNFSPMGYSVAAPVGAKFAASDKPIVAIVEDGSFLMNGLEMATAVNYKRQVIWVIQNNSKFKSIDFVKLAEGMGGKGIKITKPGEINKNLIDKIIASGKPTVINAVIDKFDSPL